MQYIFVHGLGQTAKTWDKTIEKLSGKPAESGDAAGFSCPDLPELLRHKDTNYLNLYTVFTEYCDNFSEPLTVCGLSLGAVLALHYGIEHPQKIKSLILIGAQYRMPRKLLAFQNTIFRFMPQNMFRRMGFEKEQFISLCKSMMELDFSDDLDKILCPVLVICGERDQANMRSAKELTGRLAHAEFCVIRNAGHEVNLDAPEELADRIILF